MAFKVLFIAHAPDADFENGTFNQLTTAKKSDYHPIWSPDGQKILFQSNRAGNSDLWIYSLIKNAEVQLTSSNEFDGTPIFSPDSRFIAYSSGPSGRRDIWIQSLKNVGRICVTKEYDNSWPDWSPEGNRIVYSYVEIIIVIFQL